MKTYFINQPSVYFSFGILDTPSPLLLSPMRNLRALLFDFGYPCPPSGADVICKCPLRRSCSSWVGFLLASQLLHDSSSSLSRDKYGEGKTRGVAATHVLNALAFFWPLDWSPR